MQTKYCPRCNRKLPIDNFYSRGKLRTNQYNPYCKPCFNAYTVDRWIQRKLDAIEYLGGECKICGYNKHYSALQFHHRDPSKKKHNWSKIRLRRWETVKVELDKCDLLCANCHFELHAGLH